MFFNKKVNQNELKQRAAQAAIEYIKPGMVVGIGTGSTVNFFIDELVKAKAKVEMIVSSSESTTSKLKAYGFEVVDLNYPSKVDIYIDGADEANKHRELIKGGGAALTREKICRVASNKFVCIIDQSKLVTQLGKFPLAVEVIPMARSYVAKELMKIGGQPVYREGVITDNGNIILDIHNFMIDNPLRIEQRINQITGVVCNGIFAVHPADVLLIANETNGVNVID
ncbi:ribose-5-phosphate isomerase RpiA [Fastidiosibacter lacustris]|uniref:ribose-5-phosphate isomerase RpiA n=1 Tax=Fastidiosibacter lacustris TaxID=2056695 RepID=UPI000E3451B9|nr:ribose-5-phosphate isomerase RpiA [Fastidiosibacter lacustris]